MGSKLSPKRRTRLENWKGSTALEFSATLQVGELVMFFVELKLGTVDALVDHSAPVQTEENDRAIPRVLFLILKAKVILVCMVKVTCLIHLAD